ncbi:MAG: Stk1 family PASTA domain-containing Ser/Thr kinase [Candidatus Eremiobacteraeota bacterium]|nr:Stk1 family PASTA domain-containing Ser/Thr kinase [Candidatus Eremiobacteraeota bacterium]NNM93234.1 Stk1 family PASTA domain-containing Ser/Thr kinase [Candidatus Eremiobacteraeota bacterium]
MIEQHTIAGRYRLEERIGEGGMAVVYSGTDALLRRRIAIKVLRDQYAADQEFVRRFYQEAESVGRLSHPNVVNTYDVGHEDSIYYIVMEFVDGCSLAEIISSEGRLPEPVAIDYAAQVCQGLAYAHRQGLLHRDIKPANILVGKDDVVKLSDFGIARAFSEQTMAMTRPGLVMGSVYYLSPEQAQSRELTPASDLYSVGIVLYQMLLGELPYTADSPVAVAIKHIGDPVPIVPADSGVSPALAAIVNKLLQKEPAHRFAAASDLASALREARERPNVAAFATSDDAPPTLRSPLPPRRSPLPDRRNIDVPRRNAIARSNPAVVPLFIVLAIVAAVAGFAIFGQFRGTVGGRIAIADFRNMSVAQAQAAIVADGLQVRFLQSPSNHVPADRVIRQNPSPGSLVQKNSLVELIVSNGLPLVGLPDVRGFLAGDAERSLTEQGFHVRIERRFDAAAKESVVAQRPAPGARARAHSLVVLVVSLGPQPIDVPNLVGLDLASAQKLVARLGLTLDIVQQSPIPGVAAGTIASQDLVPGQSIAQRATLHVVVSTGAGSVGPPVTLPNLVGIGVDTARAQLARLGLLVTLSYSVDPGASGTVLAEQPNASSSVSPGSSIALTVAVPGEVPDTEGMTVEQARATLEDAGYHIGSIRYTTTEGANGDVVHTEPLVGTTLSPGANVTLVVNGKS